MIWRPGGRHETSRPRPVGESLDRVTKGLGGPSSGTVAALFGRWDELVGAHISAHARPLALVKGVLSVGVDDPAWAVQLGYMHDELLAKIRGILGDAEIARIQVKVRPR